MKSIGYRKEGINFYFSQDAIDLFLGNYIVQDGEGKAIPCPLVIERGWKQATVQSQPTYLSNFGNELKNKCFLLFQIVPVYPPICGSNVLRLGNTAARIQHREFVVYAILGFNDRSHTQRHLPFRIRVRGLPKVITASQIGRLNTLN